jgi:exodeoxyribonuclease VII small subunit
VTKKDSLEQQIIDIESLVTELESDDIQLEKAVEKYAKAITLTAKALKQLDTVKSTLTVLQKEGDTLFESNNHDFDI